MSTFTNTYPAMKNRKTLLFILLIFSVHAYAISFRNLSAENGLSSNRVFQIEKDTTGFMWFVTYMGINRYDGTEIRDYKLNDQGVTEEIYFPSTKMVKDRTGCIWIALHDGRIFTYNKRMDDFELVIDIRKKLVSPNHVISSITFDKKNQLWICTNMGLYQYKQGDCLQSILPLKDKFVNIVVQQEDHSKYFAATSEAVYGMEETEKGNYVICEKYALPSSCSRIESLLYNKGKLYIGTESKSVFIIHTLTNQYTYLNHIIPNLPVRAITQVKDNQVLIGTDGSGLYIIDAATDRLVTSYIVDDDVSEGLKGNSVYDTYVDNAGCIWVATYTNGITIINASSPKIAYTRHELKDSNSLINNHVNVIFEDTEGDLWYGTNNGISVYSKLKKQWKHFLHNQENKAVILSICQDKEGSIWVGGYGIGAYRIDKRSGSTYSLLTQGGSTPKVLTAYHIYAIYADGANLWFGSLDNGLIQYDVRKKSFRHHRIESIGDIKPLNDSILLCGTANGLVVFNKNTSHFKEYLNLGDRIQNRAIRNLIPVSSKEIWMSTEGNGIICYNMDAGSYTSYTGKEGMKSNYIHSLQLDDLNRLWFTTNKEIAYIDLKTKTVVNIGEYIGMNQLEYSYHVACKRRNGHLVFGTSNQGAVEFLPLSKPDIDLACKLQITDFKLFYSSVKVGGEYSLLTQTVNETNSISLAYNQNSFSFAFSSVNFTYQHLISYTYKLEGFDEEWHVAPDNNMINYTNISPGNYKFRLRALNKDSGEVIDERELTIGVSRPYWQSAGAWSLYVLLVAFLLRFVIQYIKNKIDKRYSREKIRFFVNVAHDIRTPVSLIKAPLNDLEESETLSAKGKQSLDIAIRNTERLFLMVSQLLDFEKADLSALRLIVTSNELAKYMRERVSLFEVEAEHRQIRLTCDIDFDNSVVWFDAEKMDKIVNNLLSNAIKYTKAGGQVHVKVYQDEKKWFLIVTDTGIGIPASEQKYLFNSFFRAKNAINSKETGSGIGLLFTRKLVKLHKGEITFSSKEGVGTEFSLAFRKGEGHLRLDNKLNGYLGNASSTILLSGERQEEKNTEEKRKITLLLAEDNDEMRLFLNNSLSADYSIVEAANGEEALDMATRINPDLIISDIMMPMLNGDEMCARLKGSMETSHIPVILLTALANKEDIIKGLDCGADDYVTKPFDISILKARIRTILANRKKIREAALAGNIPTTDIEYATPLDKEFMEKILTLIDENMEDPEFSINNLCVKLGMSRSSLYNKLKSLTDQAPNDFIRILRLKKAVSLLHTHKYNISEIATMTGFPDSSYFSTAFKKQYGMSPRKYISEASHS